MASDVLILTSAQESITKRRSDLEMDFMLDLLVTIKFYPVT